MPKIKRTRIVSLMECAGFPSASALSTRRLQKKINRLNRVIQGSKDLENASDHDLETLKVVMNAIEAGSKILVEEDRPKIPSPEESPGKFVQRSPRASTFNGRGSSSRNSKYNWDKILNGSIVQLEQGSDYDCKSANFAIQVKLAAKRRGQNVRVAVKEGSVIVQALQEARS